MGCRSYYEVKREFYRPFSQPDLEVVFETDSEATAKYIVKLLNELNDNPEVSYIL